MKNAIAMCERFCEEANEIMESCTSLEEQLEMLGELSVRPLTITAMDCPANEDDWQPLEIIK